ncbi:MAG: dihydrolipoyl dehydrogenase [Bacteroidetes bacterium]|nr:dihydrolipoyl dehydrogenase [Bacteroidota bacterium]MBV6460234.1 Dihydrolipoyl dehydrogenase 3 [Flavobacteriales bacterium]WKZ74602.1 MAG: dihydrolipoyl dehydrogenase [Vicingaceae bacterium]MCL4816854.1 dihydrolipoyl dehydrogenase [Flavobacteriales bacterium]NOG94909.1 dihydrolipoyl dehydrogenase [Bacteroidota bacterium]
MTIYDVVIIGSGPGGYVCAIRCAQLGLKTALIEKYKTLGGTCLNVGCIPSKTLLDSSEHFYNAKHHFAEHGIELSELKPNLAQMIKRKNTVVSQTCAGIDFLMKKNKIDVYNGIGSFDSSNIVSVKTEKETTKIEGKNIVIATGSKPSTLPGIEIDKKRIITSTEALSLNEIPKHLVVIGGGVIGLELGSVYMRLGAKVSVVEYADSLIPAMDKALGKELQRVLKKQGMEFFMQCKVKEVKNTSKEVVLKAEDKNGKELQLAGDYCLVCVGRKPFTEGLQLEKAGVKISEKGIIETNEHLQTNVATIYAIGDVVKGPMLAHKAEEEGVFVAETIAGQKPHIHYHLIPGVVYTWPEVSAVGYSEEQLKEKNISYNVGNFPFRALGRARASMDIDGFAKILSDSTTDEVLGVHIIGPRAADLIMEAVVAMEYKASAEDIARMCHPHPTFTEALKEAALDATSKRALHM